MFWQFRAVWTVSVPKRKFVLPVTLFKSSFWQSNVILSGCVTFCCYVGVVGEAVVFQRTVVFLFLQLQLFSVEGVLLVSRILYIRRYVLNKRPTFFHGKMRFLEFLFFSRSHAWNWGAAYTQVRLIHESLQYVIYIYTCKLYPQFHLLWPHLSWRPLT